MQVRAVLLGLSLLAGAPNSWAEAAAPTPELRAAEQIYRTVGPLAALGDFERLAADYASAGNEQAEGVAQRFVGEIQWRLGRFEQAEQALHQSLALAHETGDPRQRARVLNVFGLLRWDQGRYEQALHNLREAGRLAAENGDAELEGAALNNSGLVLDELGEYDLSLEQYEKALQRYEGVDFPRGRGDTLGNIGGVHLLLGHYGRALDSYRQALAISEQLQSVTAMSQDHGNIALCLLGTGELTEALRHFDRAIELAGQAGSRQDVAYWSRGRADALMRLGRYDQGLLLHREAVLQYEAIGARSEAVEIRFDLGRLYLALGDSVSAEKEFRESLVLAREIGLERGVTMNLVALGDLMARRQAPEEANALYGQAVHRAQEAGETGLHASALLHLASGYILQGRFDEAGLTAAQALAIAERNESRYGMAEARYWLAEASRLQGRQDAALAQYRAALAVMPDPVDPDLGWRIQHGMGLAQAELGRLTQAIVALQQAIAYIESVRDRLDEQRFRAGYLQDKHQVYIDLVRLQIRAGATGDAFATAERLRGRSFLDRVADGAPLPPEPEDQLRAVELQEQIRRLRRALNDEDSLPGAQRRQPAIRVYSRELLAAEQAYQALLDDRRRLRLSGREMSEGAGYDAVRQRLHSGEALIEYVVSGQDVTIFVLTREELRALTSPLGELDLRSKVELLRDLLRDPDSERWQRPAASLARTLVEPLQQADLLHGIDHLYLVPHGSLNYLPFAMLPTGAGGASPLVDRFTLAYLPTAAALLQDQLPSRRRETLLALAPARTHLRHAPEEASGVFGLFGAGSRLLVGAAATETAFKEAAGKFDLLHLATHGYFNQLNPWLSGLELEADEHNDGQLELHEIVGLELEADLVTLSACQTGLSSGYFADIPAGDDFVGLARAFLSAGSGAVMATLWEVDDASTAELMRNFYARLRVGAETSGKAVALAEAQRRLKATDQYRHPYYWAPFVLIGPNRPRRGQALGA